MQKTATCRLCLKEKSLCVSHVIPESLWKRTYDEKHRVREIGPERGRMRWLQKGLKEPLLCSSCEEHLNQFETYFHDIWVARGLPAGAIPTPAIRIQGFDYARFRLFHLSVLWRASVATSRQFENVSLHDEDHIREMILHTNPGVPEDYGILAYGVVNPTNDEVLHGIVTSPNLTLQLDDKHVGYDFIFGGCLWRYIFDASCLREFESIIFRSDGTLTVIRLPVTECTSIMALMNEHTHAR
jgi:hypothetical protein